MNNYSNFISKARANLGFNDYPLMLIGIPLLAFFMPIIFFQAKLEEGFIPYCSMWGKGILFTGFYWLGNRAIISYYRRRYPLLIDNRRRVILQSLSMFAFVVLSSLSLDYLQHDILELDRFKGIRKTEMIIPSLFSTLAIASIYEAIYYTSKWKSSIAEAEKLKRENALSQLDTLRNQVNPHFLFNSLNTLASIIPENQDTAVEFVQKLSRVYRYILEIGDRELITLKEELEALKAYIFLIKARFGDSITVEINIPEEALEMHLVPLGAQMLLENAVKHNVVSAKRPLKIELFIDQKGDLVVRNNLQRKSQLGDSTGVGLKNISNRYHLISGTTIDQIVSESSYTVILPLLEVKEYASNNH